jgi:hypothetical protein
MHWKRRQPKWPYLVSLVCLFIITVAAPWSWQLGHIEHEEFDAAAPSADVAEEAAPPPAPLAAEAPTFVAPRPALPPLAAPTAPEPSLAAPMVIADDYVAVDEPLEIFDEPEPPVALAPQQTSDSQSAAVEPSLAPATEPEAPELSLLPVGRSVLVRNVAPPVAAVRNVFNVQSLAKVRDALTSALVQLREAEARAAAEAQAAPRVTVSSESDRLAMVPPRNEPEPTLQWTPSEAAPSPTPPAPIAAPRGRPALRYAPTALIEELKAIELGSPGASWASQVLTRIEQMSDPQASAEEDWQPTVAELRLLSERGFSEALTVADPADQSGWLRASRCLDRRLPVWSLLVDRQYSEQPFDSAPWTDHSPLIHSLHEVAALTAGTTAGEAWRQYLRLDDVAGLTSVGGEEYAESRRAVAREVLVRLTDAWLTAEQREFLKQPPIITYGQQLRPWATGEVSLETLAALIERYEATGSMRDADAIAELRLRMKWSADPRLQAVAEELNGHYRNANMRVAISAEMMNRMIPPQEVVTAPVRSRIAGADVHGQSQTETEITVRLLPDPRVWRFGLEAHGKVKSRTASQTWPARLRNASQMDYEVRKLVIVNRFGLHAFPAEANAEGDTRLLGVDSSFEAVPIIGSIIESAAREQHHASRPRAVAQVKEKVRQEARERMDREGGERLARLNERLREHVLEPLDRFALMAEPVDMSTTEERATMRLRIAGEQHLAAHTPRPSAPSDSLASFQLHESVFNNAARGLELDGRRLNVAELHQLLTQKIKRHAEAEPADLPRAAKVEFAPHDAVRVRCHGDRLELILNIVELRHGRDSIRGVGVHAFFRPVVEGMEVKLVRDGTLQFDGAHLRTGPRLVLHSVFGKLLPKDQEVPVLAAKLSDDPRFAGLMVTQLVIDDGWVALSLGPATPERVAWRTRGAEVR